MSDQETADLRERLAELEKSNPRKQPKARPAANAAKMAGLLCGGAVLAGLVYVYSQPEGAADLGVREAREFQTEGSGFGDLENRPRPAPEPEPVEVAAPETSVAPVRDNTEVVDLIRGLQDQIDRLSEAPAEYAEGEPVVDTAALDQMRGELD